MERRDSIRHKRHKNKGPHAGNKSSEMNKGHTHRKQEILGVILLSIGIILALALWSYTPEDKALLEKGSSSAQNLIGPAGHHVAGILLSTMGLGSFLVVGAFLAFALACLFRRRVQITFVEAAGCLILVVCGAILAHLVLVDIRPFDHPPGGTTGAVAGELLRAWLNTTGAVIVAGAMILLALTTASDFTILRLLKAASAFLRTLLEKTCVYLSASWQKTRELRAERAERREMRRMEKEAAREMLKAEKEAAREMLKAEQAEAKTGILPVQADQEHINNDLIAAEAFGSEEKSSPKNKFQKNATNPDYSAANDIDSGKCQAEKTSPESFSEKLLQIISTGKAETPLVMRSEGSVEADDNGMIPASDSPDNSHDNAVQTAFDIEKKPGIGKSVKKILPPHFAYPIIKKEEKKPCGDRLWGEPQWVDSLLYLNDPSHVADLSSAQGSANGNGNNPGPENIEKGQALIKEENQSSSDIIHSETETNKGKCRREKNNGVKFIELEDSEIQEIPDSSGSSEVGKTNEPSIIEPKKINRRKKKSRNASEAFAYTSHGEKFILPSIDYLAPIPENTETELDREALVETAGRLTRKLGDFGINGEVVRIRPGPVITMYEFRPGPGVKISKIQNLSDDLAMAMEALRVRIVAPIPGKNAVGIEVPNAKRQIVLVREIVEHDGFQKSKSRLTLAMGKDTEGDPVVVDLAKMPHLLIAGTTGSGKSVAVNGMITSMLYKSTPDEVRFIMIDPKVLELKLYEGIPHLLLPVVTDPAKAALALRWATEEMDRRYHLLADLNVRDLATFNKKVSRLKAEWEERQNELPPLPPPESVEGDSDAYNSLLKQHEERWISDPPPPEKLPLLVIVIDELADLMMVASREVETYIARLAQKARASGIHLIVATQRPSTDVLTGVIKINFPARISFRVASRHDSQTIINVPGAEKLLGNGDMLIIPPGQSEPMRAHGAFLAEEEIEKIVEHLKSQGEPVYDESILQPREDNESSEEADEDLDPKWDEALAILSDRDTISVSWIQRRLAIGYNRAARMMEKMERDGIVGPADGSKPREVLMGRLQP